MKIRRTIVAGIIGAAALVSLSAAPAGATPCEGQHWAQCAKNVVCDTADRVLGGRTCGE